jgi:hypothetical protein
LRHQLRGPLVTLDPRHRYPLNTPVGVLSRWEPAR